MFGVVDPPRSVVVPEVMVWVRFENSDRECSFYFHAHLQGAPEPTKKAAAHIGTAAFARSFVRELQDSRASTGSSRLRSNHRGYSQPGWQTTASATAVPNAPPLNQTRCPMARHLCVIAARREAYTPNVAGRCSPPLRPAFALATIRSQPPNGSPSQATTLSPTIQPRCAPARAVAHD